MIRDDPRERLLYLRPEDLAGVEVLASYGSLQPWHVFHETYAFCACRTAAAGWRYRGGSHLLTDGGVMLLEPGETHCNTDVHKRSDFKVVHVPTDELENAARELGVAGAPHFEVAQTGDSELFAAIYRFAESVESGDTILRQQSLLADCIRVLLGYAERKPGPFDGARERRAVARVKAHLEERCCEAVTLEELCAAAGGISRFWLEHAFTRQLGLPPHAYQIHVRIERARLLLGEGMPPALVASELGFSDQSHFARHFKRIMRVTPGEYARAGRAIGPLG